MKLKFEFERETKNMVRFAEVTKPEETPAIGSLYVSKTALKNMGWKPEGALEVEVKVTK